MKHKFAYRHLLINKSSQNGANRDLMAQKRLHGSNSEQFLPLSFTEKITQMARYLISETQPEWNENPTTSTMTEKSSTNWCSNLWCLYMDIWCKDPGALKKLTVHRSLRNLQISSENSLESVKVYIWIPPGRRKTSGPNLAEQLHHHEVETMSWPWPRMEMSKKISVYQVCIPVFCLAYRFLSLTIFWLNFLFIYIYIDRRVCLYLPSLQVTGLRTWKLMVGRWSVPFKMVYFQGYLSFREGIRVYQCISISSEISV